MLLKPNWQTLDDEGIGGTNKTVKPLKLKTAEGLTLTYRKLDGMLLDYIFESFIETCYDEEILTKIHYVICCGFTWDA